MLAPEDAEALLASIELNADRRVREGDLPGAQLLLERVVGQAPSRIESWLKLAAIRRGRGDTLAALAAVRGALEADPLHFMALISRARLLEAMGEHKDAARAYRRALAQLPEGEAVSPALQPLLAHARSAIELFKDDISLSLEASVADLTLSDCERDRLMRFHSNMLHRTKVYHSEPTHYHYPGLSEREFHCRDRFPWIAALEESTDIIRMEFEALHANKAARAEPYIRYAADVPVRQWSTLNNSLDWTAYHLLHGGRRIADNAALCPQTMELLAAIDQPEIGGRSPNAMFSLLRPRTHIPPHTGIANTRLVCHLPLIVPDGCSFRVGAAKRPWRVGEAFIFDDTIEHEAMNDSDEPRIVLIIDLWHPDLSAAERLAVRRVMEAEEAQIGAPL
jgi:aspartyl/asparaginyl beta-hydroxylase (cupin superfamily)